MKSEQYTKFNGDLTLRDYLALDRTVLANERTLLSYIRTAVAFAAAGAALVHFFDLGLIKAAGWVLIPLAAVVLLAGVRRYISMRRRLNRLVDGAPAPGSE